MEKKEGKIEIERIKHGGMRKEDRDVECMMENRKGKIERVKDGGERRERRERMKVTERRDDRHWVGGMKRVVKTDIGRTMMEREGKDKE